VCDARFARVVCTSSSPSFLSKDPHKSNQDDHGITMDFGDETGDAFFAVYDGHGSMGQQAATFCKKSLPRFVACQLRQKRVKLHQTQLKEEGKSLRGSYKDSSMWPKLSISDYEIACRKGFIECNKAIRDDPKVTS
jgi:serine/threonine protein phosphatase PrpC